MTDESMRSALEKYLNEQDHSTAYTVKMVTRDHLTAFYAYDEDGSFGTLVCTSETYDAYMAMEDAISIDKEPFYRAFRADAVAHGFTEMMDKHGVVTLRERGYGPYEQPVMTMTTGLGTMVVYQYGTPDVYDEVAIDLFKDGKTCNLAIVGVNEDERTMRVFAYDDNDDDEPTRTVIPIEWNKLAFHDLRFGMTSVTSNGKYEVYVKVQDTDSGDWLMEPFEYGTDSLEEAYEVYRLLLNNREKAIESCRKAMGMTEDEFKREIQWLELSFIDTETDECVEEPEAL